MEPVLFLFIFLFFCSLSLVAASLLLLRFCRCFQEYFFHVTDVSLCHKFQSMHIKIRDFCMSFAENVKTVKGSLF